MRRLIELGRAARAESKVKTRQPLAQALDVRAGLGVAAGPTCSDQVRAELNVVEHCATLEQCRGGRGRAVA